MVKECIHIKTEIYTREIFPKAKEMEWVNMFILMEIHMKGNGQII